MYTLSYWQLVFVVCLCSFSLGVPSSKDRSVNKDDVTARRTAVSDVLGVPDFTQWSSAPDSSPPVRWERPPRFMTRLYNLYRAGRVDTSQPDTVRSIRPKTRAVTRETLLVFNLSSITGQERVHRAEVHMYIRKRRRSELANMHARVVVTTPTEVRQENRVEFRQDKKQSGWALLDVSGMVQDGGEANSWSGALLVLSLRPNRHRDAGHSFRLGRYIGRKSQPFLVVFSQEIFNDTQTDPPLSARTHSQGKDKTFNDKMSVVKSGRLSRGKRSIYNNEIPQNPTEYEYAHVNVYKTHPDMLMSRKESKRRLGHSNLIPYPDRFRRKFHRHRKGKRWRNRNKKNFQEKPKFSFSKNSWHDLDRNLATPPLDTNMCTRRRLVVNFVDIGWGEWIISPKSFEAHYCSGTCPFPLSKRLRPSNHATIQSLIHAIGVYPDVPPPCCVPDVVSSVTLLYFDEDKNVVLKNYPHMSVESCACR